MIDTLRTTIRRPVTTAITLVLLLAAGGCGTALPTQPGLDPSGAAPAAGSFAADGLMEVEIIDTPGGGSGGSDGYTDAGTPAQSVGQPPLKKGKKPKKNPR